MSNRPANAIYGADVLDKIAALWAKSVKTTEIAHKLRMPHGSVCRLARLARLRGDDRFPARLFAPQRGPRPPKPQAKASKARAKPARLKPRPAPRKSNFNPVLLLYPRIYELKEHACRYPTGEREGEQRFCAKRKREGSSYCAEHHTLCISNVRQAGRLVAFAGRPR